VFQHGEHCPYLPKQRLNGKGLSDIIYRPGFIPPYLVALLVIGSQKNHQRVRILRLYEPAQVIAVTVRQVDIQKHQVKFRPG
jgi:hypothetical protein